MADTAPAAAPSGDIEYPKSWHNTNDELIANGNAPVKREYWRGRPRDLTTEGVAGEKRPGDDRDEPGAHKKKKGGGRNQNAGVKYKAFGLKLCFSFASTGTCTRENCTHSHDLKEYNEKRPADIGDRCYVFDTFGFCKQGLTCRFAGAHTAEDLTNVVDEEKRARPPSSSESNQLNRDVQHLLHKWKYPFSKAPDALKAIENMNNQTKNGQIQITDTDAFKALPKREKKPLNFKGKTYLAPLTTLGNLPFRRIEKEFGVDITIGEMVLASSLLSGTFSEWSLLKRHSSEDFFGVQIAGGKPDHVVRCCEVIENELVADGKNGIDFVDLNCGCPIDLLVKQGGGSAMLERPGKLAGIVAACDSVLSVPFTIKTRIGASEKNPTTHKSVALWQKAGAASISLHGRSRQQRYSRLANWEYVYDTSKLVTVPFNGNGDVFHWTDAVRHWEDNENNLSALMVGRGALIKPWIFTEIKERRHWDISSSERLDILKRFVNYGLEHWGSDEKGVETTRRFLLEWQSFLCRYIPVGLLDVIPPNIMNLRPPTWGTYGRDDLETLMLSQDSNDWIKISEMLLGKAPEGFQFTPKHKSNSYDSSNG